MEADAIGGSRGLLQAHGAEDAHSLREGQALGLPERVLKAQFRWIGAVMHEQVLAGRPYLAACLFGYRTRAWFKQATVPYNLRGLTRSPVMKRFRHRTAGTTVALEDGSVAVFGVDWRVRAP